MYTMKNQKLIKYRAARSERGAAMIDYAILTSLIAVVSLGSLASFGNSIQKVFCEKIMQINYISSNRTPIIDWNQADPTNKFCAPRAEEDESPDPLF